MEKQRANRIRMNPPPPPFKKPKLDDTNSVAATPNYSPPMAVDNHRADEEDDSLAEQEEALVALIEHRAKELDHLRHRLSYYKSQVDESEKRLRDSEAKLARLQGRNSALPSKSYMENGNKSVEVGRKSPSRIHVKDGYSRNQPQPQPRSELVIPGANSKLSQPIKSSSSAAKASNGPNGQAIQPITGHSGSGAKTKVENRFSSDPEKSDTQSKGIKRKFEQKEHRELIPMVSSCSLPNKIVCHTSNHISSQHKRKLRSLALCPVNDQLFVTSALDGVVNVWQIQSRGSGASLLSSTECLSPKQRRWPEDVTWNPQGNSLFAVYTADSGDSQISILNLNKTQGRARVTFLEDKPHVKGIINNIIFMPWENICFATGGSDHAVILWNEKDGENLWKPKALHRNMHSSAVMGVAGMQQKQIILSVGADKRIIGFDAHVGRADFRHQIDYKCMSVVPNPCDFNLFMVQSGSPGKQLRLYDIRLRQTEIHAFGWKQESSESQSALINQAWSPDGLFISSGSADPMIHIFDIRYNAHKPSQSIRAHQKRVFKAEWHSHLPLLISISSDLNIGLHKI